MAKRIKSAQKQARKSLKRRLLNRQRKHALKKALKQFAATGNKADALKQLPKVQSVIDRSARKRIIHRKAASRLKSRVARETALLK